MGSEESWQPKDWWSSLGKNGWPSLMGSFHRENSVCKGCPDQEGLWDRLAELLSEEKLSKDSVLILILSKSKCCCNSSGIPAHTHLVVAIRGVLSPRWTVRVPQLGRRLGFAKNELHSAKHETKVT